MYLENFDEERRLNMRLYVVFQKSEKDFRAGMIKRGNAGLEYIEYKKITCVSDVQNPKQFKPLEHFRYLMDGDIRKLTDSQKIWVHNASKWD